ncbi:hypothetical protein HU200_008034 [Digitaria exilis]|uniref:Rx N-terminal domain-containing protein n=1 Tax=Digitaria exilis TaxID=1010633 RepID=A0A835FM63_9POAL|nr:hypothetical protein HU200_008034 [Digitaria exilis]
MENLALGLAKTTVEGTITLVRSAMEEEDKLQESVQRDLLVISDELEMMHSFLNDVNKGHVTDNVARTQVRQVRDLALHVEDCIESALYLDKKTHYWWRKVIRPCYTPAAPPAKDLEATVAHIEQLKARVEAMGQRNLHYKRIGNDENEEVKNHNVRKKVNDDQLKKVISVLGTGSDLEMVAIEKAYHDSETCKSFKYRAWVKLVHPFNPIEFIRSVLAQFYKNLKKQFCQPVITANGETLCAKQEETLDFLDVLMATDNELIVNFKCQMKLKYLVVLEDVSTMVDWEAVRGYLPDKKNGSRIVVHTRLFEVARSCVGNGYQVSELEKNPPVHLLYKEVWTKLLHQAKLF